MKVNATQILLSIELILYKRENHINKSSIYKRWWKDQTRFRREGALSCARKDEYRVLYGVVFCIKCLWVSTKEGCIRGKKAVEKSREWNQAVFGAWKIFLCGWRSGQGGKTDVEHVWRGWEGTLGQTEIFLPDTLRSSCSILRPWEGFSAFWAKWTWSSLFQKDHSGRRWG